MMGLLFLVLPMMFDNVDFVLSRYESNSDPIRLYEQGIPCSNVSMALMLILSSMQKALVPFEFLKSEAW